MIGLGDPKKSRRKFSRPRKPWSAAVLEESGRLAGLHGLRNKKELWKVASIAERYKRIARKLLTSSKREIEREQEAVVKKLRRMGVLGSKATLDDVLDLKTSHFLERRLQTIVWRKGLATTPYMARQLVVHGKVRVGGRRIRQPGFLVSIEEEDSIECSAHILEEGKESQTSEAS